MNTNTTTPAADDLSANPRYRITGKNWAPANFIASPPGTEFASRGWPPNGGSSVEGINEPARRIVSWLQANRSDPFKPEAPWNDDLGGFYLPGRSADPRAVAIAIVAPENALPNMPAYKAQKTLGSAGYSTAIDADIRFPHRVINAGDQIVTLDWPRFWDGEFIPRNAEAETVMAYYAAARGHPKLLASPWNWFTRSIVLPALPAAQHWGTDYPAMEAA